MEPFKETSEEAAQAMFTHQLTELFDSESKDETERQNPTGIVWFSHSQHQGPQVGWKDCEILVWEWCQRNMVFSALFATILLGCDFAHLSNCRFAQNQSQQWPSLQCLDLWWLYFWTWHCGHDGNQHQFWFHQYQKWPAVFAFPSMWNRRSSIGSSGTWNGRSYQGPAS